MAGPHIRRLYYSTREVCSRIGISQTVLRTWEHKFPHCKPARSQSGRKLYKPGDLKLILKIKQFKDSGYTDDKIHSILWPQLQPGAAKKIDKNPEIDTLLEDIGNELKNILALINSGRGPGQFSSN